MNYRLVMSYSDEIHHVIYGFNTAHPEVKVKDDRAQREVVFEAPNDSIAEEIFSLFQNDLAKKYKRWSISLQRIRIEGRVIYRTNTLCTAINKRS